jgi:hypothetical protein
MIFTKNYFNRENIEDITYQDLVDYFKTEKHENDKIEYKSFMSGESESQRQKEKGIIKAISSFLNSDGGLLIWGAPKGQKVEGKKEKIFIGDLSLVDYLYEKDQFISKITDSITPVPRGILFHRIEHQGKYAYILEISKSEYSPHQFDNQFYMRIDGQSKPAPYHYIEALFKQIKYPNIESYIKIENWQLSNGKHQLYISLWIFNLSPLQNEYNISYRLICNKGKFQHWNSQFQNINTSFESSGHEKRRHNAIDILHYGQPLRQIEIIEFDQILASNSKEQVELILAFGGKHSPMKMSTYILELTSNKPKKLSSFLKEMKENQRMGLNDVTEEERIKKILER